MPDENNVQVYPIIDAPLSSCSSQALSGQEQGKVQGCEVIVGTYRPHHESVVLKAVTGVRLTFVLFDVAQ